MARRRTVATTLPKTGQALQFQFCLMLIAGTSLIGLAMVMIQFSLFVVGQFMFDLPRTRNMANGE